MLRRDALLFRIIRRLRPRVVEYLSRPGRLSIAEELLEISLQCHGYKNWRGFEESGEAHLVHTLKRLKAIDVCLDIGANTGSFSDLLLNAGAARVTAFEPHPAHRSSLRAVEAQFPERFSIIEAAVGETSGQGKLFFREARLGHASLVKEANRVSYVKNNRSISVQVVSVDDFIHESGLEFIDFVKIDTEGFESEVLVGAQKLLRQQPPKAILLEFNWHQLIRGQSLLSLSDHLRQYQAFQLLRGQSGVRPVEADKPDANFFYFSNFVFVRADIADKFYELSNQA